VHLRTGLAMMRVIVPDCIGQLAVVSSQAEAVNSTGASYVIWDEGPNYPGPGGTLSTKRVIVTISRLKADRQREGSA
jgi:hypothetical protein